MPVNGKKTRHSTLKKIRFYFKNGQFERMNPAERFRGVVAHTLKYPMFSGCAGTAAMAVLVASCGMFVSGPMGNSNVPEPTKPVELNRYLGKWYEMARYENGFEKGCEGVTAEYKQGDYDLIEIINSCREGTPKGELRASTGKAKITPDSNNTKLRVSFFGPFYVGDYWVLDRAEDYSWSIVGEPTGRYLWILTREPVPEKAIKDMLYKRVRELGYNTELLRDTQQLAQ